MLQLSLPHVTCGGWAGGVVELSVTDPCSSIEVQGFVRQDSAWSEPNSTIAISLPALKDCTGAPFLPASAEKTLPNRWGGQPIGVLCPGVQGWCKLHLSLDEPAPGSKTLVDVGHGLWCLKCLI